LALKKSGMNFLAPPPRSAPFLPPSIQTTHIPRGPMNYFGGPPRHHSGHRPDLRSSFDLFFSCPPRNLKKAIPSCSRLTTPTSTASSEDLPLMGRDQGWPPSVMITAQTRTQFAASLRCRRNLRVSPFFPFSTCPFLVARSVFWDVPRPPHPFSPSLHNRDAVRSTSG